MISRGPAVGKCKDNGKVTPREPKKTGAEAPEKPPLKEKVIPAYVLLCWTKSG